MTLLTILAGIMNSDLSALLSSGGTFVILAFFTKFFMAELKENRLQQEKDRQAYEERIERMMERQFKNEELNRETINRLADTVGRLADKVNSK